MSHHQESIDEDRREATIYAQQQRAAKDKVLLETFHKIDAECGLEVGVDNVALLKKIRAVIDSLHIKVHEGY